MLQDGVDPTGSWILYFAVCECVSKYDIVDLLRERLTIVSDSWFDESYRLKDHYYITGSFIYFYIFHVAQRCTWSDSSAIHLHHYSSKSYSNNLTKCPLSLRQPLKIVLYFEPLLHISILLGIPNITAVRLFTFGTSGRSRYWLHGVVFIPIIWSILIPPINLLL